MNPDRLSSTPPPPDGTNPDGPATGSHPPLRFTKKQLVLAFAIAAIADVIGAALTLWPPVMWAIDALTAVLLFAVLGWQWLLLPGLVLEAIPGVGVLPFWILVVTGIAIWGTARPRAWRLLAPRQGP
jgi:hypothetical protein